MTAELMTIQLPQQTELSQQTPPQNQLVPEKRSVAEATGTMLGGLLIQAPRTDADGIPRNIIPGSS